MKHYRVQKGYVHANLNIQILFDALVFNRHWLTIGTSEKYFQFAALFGIGTTYVVMVVQDV